MSDRLCNHLMYLCFSVSGILLLQGAAIQQAKAPTPKAQTLAYRGSGRIAPASQPMMAMGR
ncbi:hypothetical protein IQ266_27675 [filamentous cyanobacterium LEGE 11480]|uniref:Uncharacterized protein n=1 Tax=Romeriopsis navalis LEGE 11480 TaxID=2777977 RepID=A0A928Z5B9_9CYAN|nr:hypothetical protein [Romeriopsis navalis]MBE9033511.1 hypothetical protein [Romeriopsis navalis LEGE 11480]